jgi:hypothetical protein
MGTLGMNLRVGTLAEGSQRLDAGSHPKGSTVHHPSKRRVVRFSGRAFGVLLSMLPACTSGPPEFVVQREPAAPAREEKTRTFTIGSLATSPPGNYRFVKVYADGRVEQRELQTFNGPGRWLAYVGTVGVSPSLARETLATLERTPAETAVGDASAPCVLAFESPTGRAWEGCAHPNVARQVVLQVPRLTAPDVSPDCRRRVCQVRLLRQEAPARHERTHTALQDIVFDQSGAFWCASGNREQQAQANTLRIERGSIAQGDAAGVFAWLTEDAERGMADDRSSPISEEVMARSLGSDWIRLNSSESAVLRTRWQQIAARLSPGCVADR